MSKYDPLETYLKGQTAAEVPISFREIEAILGRRLPPSAFRHRPWWANDATGHVHAKAWLSAGYETARVDLKTGTLVFRRARLSRSCPVRSACRIPAANSNATICRRHRAAIRRSVR